MHFFFMVAVRVVYSLFTMKFTLQLLGVLLSLLKIWNLCFSTLTFASLPLHKWSEFHTCQLGLANKIENSISLLGVCLAVCREVSLS